MASGKGLDWLKAGATVIGSVAAASRAMLEYRKFRRDQESAEYTRGMQRKAWQQVVDGELSSARVGDVEIKAPTDKTMGAQKTRTTTTAGKGKLDSSRTVVSTTTLSSSSSGGTSKLNGVDKSEPATDGSESGGGSDRD